MKKIYISILCRDQSILTPKLIFIILGRRIDDIEKSISELMNDVGVEEVEV